MAVTNNQVAHAAATFAGAPPAFTVLRADGCTLTNPAPGQYRVTLAAGFGSPFLNLKITPSVVNPTALIVNVAAISQTVIDVLTYDAAGVAADCASLVVTIEIVPRVS